MTMACFLAVCWNGISFYSFGHVQFDQHRGGIVVLLSSGSLKYADMVGLYEVIILASYDPVLYLLALRRL